MKTLLMLIGLVAIAGDAGAKRAVTKLRVAPNGRYAVRLHEGFAIGNARYNQAELIDRKSGRTLHDFGPDHDSAADLGGYENDSVVWSADSAWVALYLHDHRTGTPLVVSILGGKVTRGEVPEISLPLENDPENDGRHMQDWLKPVKWLSGGRLLLSDSGLITQYRDDRGTAICYRYGVIIRFDKDGGGSLRTLKLRALTREPLR